MLLSYLRPQELPRDGRSTFLSIISESIGILDGQPDVEKECFLIKWCWWQSSMIYKQLTAAVEQEKPAIVTKRRINRN